MKNNKFSGKIFSFIIKKYKTNQNDSLKNSHKKRIRTSLYFLLIKTMMSKTYKLRQLAKLNYRCQKILNLTSTLKR